MPGAYKPKVETTSLFLVLHPSSGVDTVNTVGSQFGKREILVSGKIYEVLAARHLYFLKVIPQYYIAHPCCA